MRFMALLTTLALAAPTAFAQSPSTVFYGSRQMITVVTSDWEAIDGKLQRYERSSAKAPWQPVGPSVSIVVGKHGLGWGEGLLTAPTIGDPMKKEGDGKSPAGVYALGTAFGYASKNLPGSKLTYLALTPAIECVDDINSTHYNRIVDRATVTPDWNSSEHMRNTGESYRWGIVVDHNGIAGSTKPIAGKGSCIFLHVWSGAGRGTAGCTAMAQADIETLLSWLDPKRKPLLVQLTANDYARLMEQWRLPTVANLPSR